MGLLSDLLVVDFLSVVLALLLVLYAYFKWSFTYWKRKGIPYTEPTFPFGNLSNPWSKSSSIAEDIQIMYNKARANGWKHFGFFNMSCADYLITDLEIAKQIGIKDFNNFVDRGVYSNLKEDPLSGHLFNLNGQRWKNLRSKMSPSFTSGKMKHMFPIVLDYGELLDRYVGQHIDGKKGPVEFKSTLGCFTNDIIASVAFGLECNSFKEPNSPFRVYGKKFFQQNSLLALRSMFNLNFPNAARKLGLRDIRTDVSDFFLKTVADAVEFREKNNYSRNDFLQLMIDYRNKNMDKGDASLSVDELAAQCFVFWLAGFETSSATMTYASYEMTRNPEVQEKLRAEVHKALANNNNILSYDTLSELKYMDQVIDETLRMYPPVPFITRQAAEDYKITGEDVVLEAGTRVNLPILGYHYDAEYFPDPFTFNPERFSDENKQIIPPFAHMPFGIGPRLCIGKRFGLMQTKVGLATILNKYKVSLHPDTENPLKIDPFSLVPIPRGGVWINVDRL